MLIYFCGIYDANLFLDLIHFQLNSELTFLWGSGNKCIELAFFKGVELLTGSLNSFVVVM